MLSEDLIGFAYRDRGTVVAPRLFWRCRRPVVVRLRDGEVRRVRSIRRPSGSELMLLELEDPLPREVAPLRVIEGPAPVEGERLYAFTREWQGEPPFALRAGHVLETDPKLVFRLDHQWEACPSGSPVVDQGGRLVAVCASDAALPLDAVVALEDGGPVEPPATTLNGGGGYGLALYVEGDGTVGFGGETDFELSLHDEWTFATAWAFFASDFDAAGMAHVFRLQHEVRLGYRAGFDDGVFGGAVEVTVGGAIGYDFPDDGSIPDRDPRLWFRPTARVRLVYGMLQLAYAVYVDLERPGDGTAHQIVFGLALEP